MNRKNYVVAWRYKNTDINQYLQCNSCNIYREGFNDTISGYCNEIFCNSHEEFNNTIHIPIITIKECYFYECPQIDNNVCVFKKRYKLKCPKEQQ